MKIRAIILVSWSGLTSREGYRNCTVPRSRFGASTRVSRVRILRLVDTIRPPEASSRAVKMTVECIEDLYPT